MATETRGEIELVLDGMTLGLRPSYEAIDAFERSTGKGLMQLARESLAGTLSTAELSLIAAECIRAHAREREDADNAKVNAKRVQQLLIASEGGITDTMVRLSMLLSMAATGGYDAKGNLKPTATKGTETPAEG